MVGYGGFGGSAGGRIQFVKREKSADAEGGAGGNMASKFAGKALRSEMAKADGQLQSDFESVLKGEAIYLPNFHCAKRDFSLLAGLAKDMEEHEGATEGGGMVNWSKHLKHENPEFSPTFKRVVDAMAAHFDVEVYATRLNFYRDGTDWKPFHHDSHAYGGREKREDFTMGASFGSERELTFLHEPSGQQFSFPQNNGDVFAFTTEVNKRFKHGVPKLVRGPGGPRFSIIAWGRRRSLNANNGGAEGGTLRRDGEGECVGSSPGGAGHTSAASAPPPAPEKVNELVMGSGDVSALIKTFLEEEDAREERERNQKLWQKPRKGRDGSGKRSPPPPPATPARPDAASSPAPTLATAVTVPSSESRGSAPAAARLRAALGEEAYETLRASARAFQRGDTAASAFYDEAVAACGGDWAPVVELASHLPCVAKRAELLACHERREFG